MPKCVVVLGMHRSGTSALAGLLNKAGVYLGDELMEPTIANPKGYFENLKVFGLNDLLLKKLNSSWDDIFFDINKYKNYKIESLIQDVKELICSEFKFTNIFAIKDPRLCYLFPIWDKALCELEIEVKVVICLRHPLEIAKSLSKRDGFSYEKSFMLWVNHLLSAEYLTRKYEDRIFLNFDNLIHDPQGVFQQIIANFGLLTDQSSINSIKNRGIDDFISPDLKHYTVSIQNFSDKLPCFLTNLVPLFLETSFKRNDDRLSSFDEIRNQFYEYINFFYFEEIKDSIRKLPIIELSNVELNKILSQVKKEVEELGVRNRQLNKEVEELGVRNGQLSKEVEELGVRNGQLSKEVEEMGNRNEELSKEVRKLKNEKIRLNDRNNTLEIQIAKKNKENIALKQNKGKLEFKIANITSNKGWIFYNKFMYLLDKIFPWGTKRRLFLKKVYRFVIFLMVISFKFVSLPFKKLNVFKHNKDKSKIRNKIIDDSNLSPKNNLNIKANTDETKPTQFIFPPKKDLYETFVELNRFNNKDFELTQNLLKKFSYLPKISIIMPVYNAPIKFLNKAIQSVFDQVYSEWELCIADDNSTNKDVTICLKEWEARDGRVKVVYREKNGNISKATNSAASLASGDYFLLMDNDDELTVNALCEVALYIADNPATDVLYSDDDKIDEYGKRYSPQFKPDWSPELLLSYMYFSHLFVVKKELFHSLGGLREGYEGSQDYDLALRATEKAKHVGHIPRILYHWRALPNSTASDAMAKPQSFEAGLNALKDAVQRRDIKAKVYQPKWALQSKLGIFALDFKLAKQPAVTIIIPTKNHHDILKRCVKSILNITRYSNYKILIIDNDSDDPSTIKYFNSIERNNKIKVKKISNKNNIFNYAYINNQAASLTDTELLLFLNNDTEVISPKWLSSMVGFFQIQGVGAVGAKLLFPDERIQHAGIVHGLYNGLAGPAFKLLPNWHGGYLSYTKVSRNYSAVTAACLLTKRSLFLELGGFDEKNFSVAYNDVDLCYRILKRGLRIVYSPDSKLYHHEGFSRGFTDNPKELVCFKKRYKSFHDPYYNPNLSFENEKFEIYPRKLAGTAQAKQKIKTLMFAHNLNYEGAPYSQYELTVGLKNKGYIEPVVFTPHNGPLKTLYNAAGIDVIIENHPLANLKDSEEYQTKIKDLSQKLKALKIEMVYANTMVTFYAIDAAHHAKIPSIWNPRESEPWRSYYTKNLRFPFQIAQQALNCFMYPYKVIFVAHATRKSKEELNIANNFTVIHNGLDTTRIDREIRNFNRSDIRKEVGLGADNRLVLILPGTVCERKGQKDLILALQRLNPEVLNRLKCFIIGDRKSQYSDEMHHLLSESSKAVQSSIEIVPETKDIFKYYFIADLFLCASRLESYPRVLLEAMYFSLPIITTPVFGITEQVKEKVNALFYKPGDSQALADNIVLLVKDDALRNKFKNNSKNVLLSLNSYDDMVESYGEIFQEAYYSLPTYT